MSDRFPKRGPGNSSAPIEQENKPSDAGVEATHRTDESAGGADSSPLETAPSGEKKDAAENL